MRAPTLLRDPPLSPGDPLPAAAPMRGQREPQGPRNSVLALALLAVVAIAPALSIAQTEWVAGTRVVLWLAPVGLVLGAVFARLRLPPLLLHLVGCLLGEAIAVWAVASTLPQATIEGRLLVLAQRFAAWVAVVRGGGQATDNLLFLLALAVLTWFIAYTSAYTVVRQGSPWWPIFANGAILLVNAAYRGRTDVFLLVYLMASLLLVVRLTVAAQERAWRTTGLVYPRGLATSATAFGGLLALGVLALAFLAPAAPTAAGLLDRLRAIAQSQPPLEAVEQARAEVERLFAGVPGQGRDSDSGFGGVLTLQDEFRPSPEVVAEIAAPRGRYWRAVTYGDYTGRGWRATTGTTRQPVEPDQPSPSAYEARVELAQRVRVRTPRGDALLAAAQPVAVGIPAMAEYSEEPGGDPVALDLASSLRAGRVRVPGAEYTVTSAISVADEASLRAASGQRDPAAIVQRYGQPPEVPARVRELAARIAPPSLSRYDRARAVEGYLRANFRYELKVPVPPVGRDGADFFLFDSKTGFCDYFATAMTVLLRSAGVPARVASGYAVGERDAEGTWIVRDANAHSWVEVYFPRYGWIEFEPSPIRPPAVRGPSAAGDPLPPSLATPTPRSSAPRPDEAGTAPALEPTPIPADDRPPAGSTWPRALLPLLGGLAALVLLAGLARLAWGWGIDGLPEGEAGYARMARLARLLGRGPRPAETPHEFASALSDRSPPSAPAIETLADAFARARFARPTDRGGPDAAERLQTAWRTVRRALLRGLVPRRRP